MAEQLPRVTLRPATEADLDFLWDLQATTLKPYVELTWGWDEAWQREHFREYHDLAVIQIIEVDSEPIGSISIEQFSDRIYVGHFEILPAYQNRGIGSRLLQQVFQGADQSGLPVTLSVLKVNPARRLYERLGFEAEGENAHQLLMRRAATGLMAEARAMRPRRIAICLVEHDSRWLVTEVPDPIKGVTGYRPLGGGIEAGETPAEAVVREFREELDVELVDVANIGELDNPFVYLGQPGRETVSVLRGSVLDQLVLNAPDVAFVEDRRGAPQRAIWIDKELFAAGVARLYPEGTLELLWSIDSNGQTEPMTAPQPGPLSWTETSDGATIRFPVSVQGVILIDGRVILVSNERGEWELPGGKLELGESPESCLAREIKEELDLNVEVGAILDSWVYEIPNRGPVLIVTYGCLLKDLPLLLVSPEGKAVTLAGSDDLAGTLMPEGYKSSARRWLKQRPTP